MQALPQSELAEVLTHENSKQIFTPERYHIACNEKCIPFIHEIYFNIPRPVLYIKKNV
jgi:hypothetical protein